MVRYRTIYMHVSSSFSSKGDAALLLPSNQQVAHECSVEHVAKEWVALKITEKAKQDW